MRGVFRRFHHEERGSLLLLLRNYLTRDAASKLRAAARTRGQLTRIATGNSRLRASARTRGVLTRYAMGRGIARGASRTRGVLTLTVPIDTLQVYQTSVEVDARMAAPTLRARQLVVEVAGSMAWEGWGIIDTDNRISP